MSKKVLIVTATPTEAAEVLKMMDQLSGVQSKPHSKEKVTVWQYGLIGNCEMSVLKLPEMGSKKANASALVTTDAVRLFEPDFVIMAGIAFGLKQKDQNIGDILISRELQDYDSVKVGPTENIQRGQRIPAGSTLIDRFDNARLRFTDAKAETGFLVSGDALADNIDLVEYLRKEFPEAIGGEMEGTGLQSACHRHTTEWIVIKGICDYGFDKQHPNKDKDQHTAIENVCKFLLYTFTNFTFS